MSLSLAGSGLAEPPAAWPGADGHPVDCRDKLRVLAANHKELAAIMADVFEDALAMGVDETAMRAVLIDLVGRLPGKEQA